MRIAVTGGSGYVGRAVLSELRSHGHEPYGVDQAPPRDRADEHVLADVLDAAAVEAAFDGADAVVHLAGVPAPERDTDARTLEVNVLGTYNVFAAAAARGIPRVVWASSETVLGVPLERENPLYAPMDEAHPVRPETPYALSKVVGEEIGRYFTRCHGVCSVALRFAMIVHPSDYAQFHEDFDDVVGRRWNLWAYVDRRDAARAVRLALERPLTGAHELIVAAADTVMERDSAALVAEAFDGVPLARPMEGHETLLAIDAARATIGYEPAHSWRDATDDPAP